MNWSELAVGVEVVRCGLAGCIPIGTVGIVVNASTQEVDVKWDCICTQPLQTYYKSDFDCFLALSEPTNTWLHKYELL